MLDVTANFIREFTEMTKEEQLARAETLTIEECEVLADAGFEFEINNGHITDVVERVN